MAVLQVEGFSVAGPVLDDELLSELREKTFRAGEAGVRCLLDDELVGEAALRIRGALAEAGVLTEEAVAVQAIAFDKTPDANWKVTWHQDVMFPFSRKTCSEGFDLPSIKAGVHFSRPPVGTLEELLAVRLHVDRCDADGGPLRVSPGSHTRGVLKSREIAGAVARHGEVPIIAAEGEMLLMRPLLLHASSKALTASHRRVLHFVFHSGGPVAEPWHRAIGMPNRSKAGTYR
jgi:ectoine hydroxylase-related dioxygenase (phytanoyl-CoA dioxygenase family)